jgi:hypothetical protein
MRFHHVQNSPADYYPIVIPPRKGSSKMLAGTFFLIRGFDGDNHGIRRGHIYVKNWVLFSHEVEPNGQLCGPDGGIRAFSS